MWGKCAMPRLHKVSAAGFAGVTVPCANCSTHTRRFGSNGFSPASRAPVEHSPAERRKVNTQNRESSLARNQPFRSRATAVDSTSTPAAKGSGAVGRQSDDWRREVLAAITDAEGFAELSIRAKVATAQPWHTITVRPVSLRGTRHLQVTTFTARQSTSANHQVPCGDAAATEAVLGPLLAAGGLGSVALRTERVELAVQITKRGKGIIHRGTQQSRAPPVSLDPARGLSHDRAKDTPIPADQPHPFLQKIGFQTADGRIRANMQDKFSQVNEFLKLLGHTGLIRDLRANASQAPSAAAVTADSLTFGTGNAATTEGLPRAPLHILDCGCGSSHLSFGTYHYLNHVLGVPATMAGVDFNAALMARANDNAAELGLQGVRFEAAPISEYRPEVRPDIVLALHACDTATDDALALAVKQSSPLIMAVPCCHAHLHKQLAGRPPSSRPPWAPLLRHGILRQRQLDLLTDTLRAQLLRVAGYRTDVVEFISTEHTPRNLLIRATAQQNQQKQPTPLPSRRQATQPAAAAAAATALNGRGYSMGCAAAATATGTEEETSSSSTSNTSLSPSSPSSSSQVDGSRTSMSSIVGRDGGTGAPSWSRERLAAAREYLALRDYWQVTPRLEVLLKEELGPLLEAAAAASAAGGPSSDEDDDCPDLSA